MRDSPHLDRAGTAASVASGVNIAILSYRIRTPAILIAISFGIASVFSQEAVREKPLTDTEETPVEEATPVKKEKPVENKTAKSIQESMTPEEFTAAGLDKLSPAELEYLDAWLQGYRHTAEKKAAEKATAEVAEKVARTRPRLPTDPILSRVDGTMVPLTGRTIIKLENGTKWKQANAEDRYRPRIKDHPAALVTHSGFGYKLRVEGMPDFYVNPVREQ